MYQQQCEWVTVTSTNVLNRRYGPNCWTLQCSLRLPTWPKQIGNHFLVLNHIQWRYWIYESSLKSSCCTVPLQCIHRLFPTGFEFWGEWVWVSSLWHICSWARGFQQPVKSFDWFVSLWVVDSYGKSYDCQTFDRNVVHPRSEVTSTTW